MGISKFSGTPYVSIAHDAITSSRFETMLIRANTSSMLIIKELSSGEKNLRLTCCYYSKMIRFKVAVSKQRICASALTEQRLLGYICTTTLNRTKPWALAQVENIHAAHLLACFAPC